MNFKFNVFGKINNNVLIYSADDKNLLVKLTEEIDDTSQMVVYRKGESIYYVFIKRLSSNNSYFGISLSFNGVYCRDARKLFSVFEDVITSKIVPEGKILKSEFTDDITFSTTDFSKNDVDISRLESYIRGKIDSDLESAFVSFDATFLNNNFKHQFATINDDNSYLIDSIKRYNYLIITRNARSQVASKISFEKRLINFKRKNKWVNLLCYSIIVVLSFLIFAGLKGEKYSICTVTLLEIPLVISLFILCFKQFTYGKNEIWLAIFSFIFSVLGIALTIDNNIYSLSEGSYCKILKRSFKKDNTIDISKSLNQLEKLPDLVFVLDVSGSTKQKKYYDQKHAKELFRETCINLMGDTNNIVQVLEKFLNLNNNKHKYFLDYDIYKLKLLNIMVNNQEKYKGKMHVICFAGDVNQKKNIDVIGFLKYINNIESNEDFIKNNKTDFNKLFITLTEKYSNHNKKSPSYTPKYTFLFFSDYLHDSGKKLDKGEKEGITKSIEKSIGELYSKQNFSNYFFTNSYVSSATDFEIPVLELIKKMAKAESKAHYPSIQDEDYDFMDIIPEEVIPIYYETSFPRHRLETTITFKSISSSQEVNIFLNSSPLNSKDFHHEYEIFEKDSVPVFPSSDVELSLDKRIKLSFTGRIINNYSATTLTFQSLNHDLIRFDVVFFKDLPWFVRYFITLTLFSFYTFILAIILNRITDK